MKIFRSSVSLAMAAVLAVPAFADTVTLRDGNQLHGAYLGGSARQVRIDLGDRIQTLDVSDILRIEFDSANTSQAPRSPTSDLPATPARSGRLLPAGTNLVVRMIDGIDSQVNRVGQTFAGSLDAPVLLDGETVIPRGADVVVKLTDAKDSGKIAGRAELTLDLISVNVNGRMVDVDSESVSKESSSRGARTAKVAGGTAALGAIIGAIAGGGKGAAIGAGAGAATGVGAEVLTKGQRVKIPSETRLTFALEVPVRI